MVYRIFVYTENAFLWVNTSWKPQIRYDNGTIMKQYVNNIKFYNDRLNFVFVENWKYRDYFVPDFHTNSV